MKWIVGITLGMLAAASIASSSFAARTQGDYQLRSTKIAVADTDRSVNFYHRYLGMKRGVRASDFEQVLEWGDSSQGSMIILVKTENPWGLKPGTALLHFHVPDLDRLAKQLKDDGYKNIGLPNVSDQAGAHFKILFIKDPDGHTVELVQPIS